MLSNHTSVYASPRETLRGEPVVLRGKPFTPLVAAGGGPPVFTTPLPPSFEQVQQRLMELPRSDCEPDGFFLLTGHEQGLFWRLNGHMHEHAGRMHRVELNGECPAESLDAVLRALGWPETELVFQLVYEGVTLCEGDFWKWAAAG